MTGEDSGTDVTSNVALRSAQTQQALAKYSIPALRSAIASMLSDLGDPGTEPASTRTEFGKARAQTTADFDAAQRRSAAGIEQEIKQSGAQFSSGATNEVLGSTSRAIDRQRTQAMSALNLQEAQSGMDQTAFLLSGLSQAGGAAASGAIGFGQNAMQAGGILSAINNRNRQEGSTYGSLIGTALGYALSAYTGGASIPIGSAAGGAIGGWLSGGG